MLVKLASSESKITFCKIKFEETKVQKTVSCSNHFVRKLEEGLWIAWEVLACKIPTTNIEISVNKAKLPLDIYACIFHSRAALRHAISAFVYCMRLHF